MKEKDFQSAVIDLARYGGWRVAHFRPAPTQSGSWATPMTGDVGYPDLTLARNGHVLHVELKATGGRLGTGQAEWGQALGTTWRLWTPADLRDNTIPRTLRRA